MINWQKPVGKWTIVAIACLGMQVTGRLTGTALTASNQVRRVAQAFPEKCAIAIGDSFVYNEPATSGQRIRILGGSEQVTLADEGINGWIAISSPVKGFVQIKDLKPCGPIGECRAAKQSIFVYDRPDSSSRKIRSMLTNEEVIVADRERNGWIAISSPVKGFVQTVDMKTCQGGDRAPGESTGRCRRVTDIVGQGLNIRALPNTESDIIGSLFPGDLVMFKINPPQISVGESGRQWVQITFPQEGWISQGFPESESSNLKAAACRE